MLTYENIAAHFGSSLYDQTFQQFLHNQFYAIGEYDIFNGYIIVEGLGIELGFTNNDAVFDDDEEIIFEKGNPIFSHFNLYPASVVLISGLPFDIMFNFTRKDILEKVGNPTKTKSGYAALLNTHFLNDLYKIGDIIVSINYNAENETLKLIQVRDNDLVEHLKL